MGQGRTKLGQYKNEEDSERKWEDVGKLSKIRGCPKSDQLRVHLIKEVLFVTFLALERK